MKTNRRSVMVVFFVSWKEHHQEATVKGLLEAWSLAAKYKFPEYHWCATGAFESGDSRHHVWWRRLSWPQFRHRGSRKFFLSKRGVSVHWIEDVRPIILYDLLWMGVLYPLVTFLPFPLPPPPSTAFPFGGGSIHTVKRSRWTWTVSTAAS